MQKHTLRVGDGPPEPRRFDPDGRERDLLGRVQPHALNPVTLERAVPGLLAQFADTLPDGRWQRIDSVAVVACRCDHVTVVPLFSMRCCEGCTSCFLFDSKRVRVAEAAPADPWRDVVRQGDQWVEVAA